MFKKIKVKTILFLSIALFITFLFLVVISVSYRFVVNETIAATSMHQREVVQFYRQELDNQMKGIEETAVVVSRNSDLQAFMNNQHEPFSYNRQRKDLQTYLHQVVLSSSIIDSIDVYMHKPPSFDNQRPVRFLSIIDLTNHPENELITASEKVWLRSRNENLKGGEDVVSYVSKSYSARGTLRAVIVLNIRSNVFRSILVGDEASDDNRLLIDKSGEIISHSRNSDIDLQQLLEERPSFNREHGNRELEQGLVVWSTLDHASWTLIELTPREELTAGGKRITAALISICVAAILSALLFAFFLSTKYSKPIIQLRYALVQFGQSQKVKVPTDYENEFGDLFSGFTQMTEEIQALHRSLDEEHQRKNEADIAALQANINPHFLYNTLDQLNWMALARNQEEISQVLELTGKMLRIGLSKGESFIPISAELDHVRYYMQIQQFRKQVAISFIVDLPDKATSYFIPKFTLQPIVENAIRHGFHRRKKGLIHISVHENADTLIVMVNDDGIGFDQNNTKKKIGYGLYNVEMRINALFNGRGQIKVESSIGRGTMVSIEIPKKSNKQWGNQYGNVENGHH